MQRQSQLATYPHHKLVPDAQSTPKSCIVVSSSLAQSPAYIEGGVDPEAMFEFCGATYRGPHPIRPSVNRWSRNGALRQEEQTLYRDLSGSMSLRPCPLAIRAGSPPLETSQYHTVLRFRS